MVRTNTLFRTWGNKAIPEKACNCILTPNKTCSQLQNSILICKLWTVNINFVLFRCIHMWITCEELIICRMPSGLPCMLFFPGVKALKATAQYIWSHSATSKIITKFINSNSLYLPQHSPKYDISQGTNNSTNTLRANWDTFTLPHN